MYTFSMRFKRVLCGTGPKPAKTGVPLGVYKVAVETTNQYTGSNMSDRQLTADLHYRTAVVLKDARHSL